MAQKSVASVPQVCVLGILVERQTDLCFGTNITRKKKEVAITGQVSDSSYFGNFFLHEKGLCNTS
jgi:hypothetical protein